MSSNRVIRPTAVLAVCCLSLLIVGIDNTIVTVALPTMRTSLHASFTAAQWTVDAYQIVLGALLVSAGAVADRWGRRRTLQVGLVVFSTASALCSIAPSVGWLLVFRVLQAVGGSMMNPIAIAIVSHAFPDPGARAKAFGIWSGVYGLSMAIGPILGGVLVDVMGWRSIFWTTVPVGLLAVVLCGLLVPESRAPSARRADPLGQILLVAVLGNVTFTVIDGRRLGWGSVGTMALIVVTVIAAVGFIAWEAHHREPLIDLRFFCSIPFTAGVLMALVGMGASGGYLWVMTFYLQNGRGLSALQTGRLLLPVALAVIITAPISGRLAAHRGPRLPLAISGIGISVSALLLFGLTDTTPIAILLLSSVAFGIGFGMLNAPITNISVAGMPPARTAVAAAIASTGRQTGQALGVAIVGALVIPGISPDVTRSMPHASHPGWWAIAASGLVLTTLAIVATTPRALRTARRPWTSQPRAAHPADSFVTDS